MSKEEDGNVMEVGEPGLYDVIEQGRLRRNWALDKGVEV